jgi:hypothetical protein
MYLWRRSAFVRSIGLQPSIMADGFFWLFWPGHELSPLQLILKVGQSLSIVTETEQIADRPNLLLKSRARISDGLLRRSFAAPGNILL